MSKKNIPYWVGIPPWIILGALLVLVPIFGFWTVQSIHKQREGMILLLLEKGAALIRSFEAGTRTGMMGMMGMRGGGFQLQRLLMETARQPDILYIIVTDQEGHIQAHSDPGKIGEAYGKELDLGRISRGHDVEWRHVRLNDGFEAFEVFRGFTPTRLPFGMRHGWGPRRWRPAPSDFPPGTQVDQPPQVIFIGLDMSSLEESRRQYVRQRIIIASVLLLVGFAGIFSLFLAQAYGSARKSLTRIKAFSDHVVENMPIGLLAVDGEGRVVSCNEAAETVLGLSSQKVLGKKAAEAIPGPLWDLAGDLGGGTKVVTKEIDCPIEARGTVPLDASISIMEGEDHVFLGHLLIFKDMTELRNLKGEIETSRRLASLGRLAAGIAHEIRNPLSSIKGFATYFMERYKEFPEDKKTAEIMIQEVERLNRVITQLLEFARPLTIVRRSISPQALIHHSLKMIEPQAKAKEIQLEISLPADPRDLYLDPDRITQVLLNLYLNSIEAMEKGGRLSVELSRDEQAEGIRIAVRDTGTGIRKEDLAHVFDPYFTTKQSGTGLGLAIVHKIIESHKGEVKVESEPGQGTTVSVFIPCPEKEVTH